MSVFDFRVEWCLFNDEVPIRHVPVLVYSQRLFRDGFNVCYYDGASRWVIYGYYSTICTLKVSSSDYWAYLPDYI